MAQLLLPLYPTDTKLITPVLGVREEEGTVVYFLSGMPIYSHTKAELHKFRFVTSNLIKQGLCKNTDIVRIFHVSTDSVRRWKRVLLDQGEEAFFNNEKRHGRSHKLLPDVLERIQAKINTGQSVNSIAKGEGISEGSIRYGFDTGKLKKKQRG
jgi:hypothetical protein